MNMSVYTFRPQVNGFTGQFNTDTFAYRPFNGLNGRLMSEHWSPAADIKEDNDHFAIVLDIPGVDPNAVDISVQDSVLTIKGERYVNDANEANDANLYHHVERVRGQFSRQFTLPDAADAEQIEARSNNGVLAVVIPKKADYKPRKINISH